MSQKQITAHEPEAELLSPDDLDNDVAVIERCLRRRRIEQLVRKALAKANTAQMVEALISAGICRDEEEAIIRGVETLFVAVFPESRRHIKVNFEAEKQR